MQFEEKKEHINLQTDILVSIITPLYNASKFISETIKSIQNQTHRHWEHIIIDDASTDNSVATAKSFALLDKRIQLISNPTNTGAAACRNQATDMAKGIYIAFLDADDLWHPEKLEKQLKFMIANNCNISYSSYLHIDENGTSLQKRICALPKLSYKKQLRNNYVGNLTGIYNAAVLGKILAPNIRKRQDWAVWLEAIKREGKPAMGIQEDLAFYRVRKGSISSNKIGLVIYNFRFYSEYLQFSLLKSCYCVLLFFWEYFLVRPKHIQKL